MLAEDMRLRRFGRLIVLERSENIGGKPGWRCACDCGKETVIRARSLKEGHTRSCGCLAKEITIARSFKHGHSTELGETPEYKCWAMMLQRCVNPRANAYESYGGRGIKVCDRWRKFENFLADMGLRPSPLHSLDRENNDGDYEPSNCRWATKKEQANNRRMPRRKTVAA